MRMKKNAFAVMCGVAALCLLSFASPAATIYVNGAAAGANDGTSWTDAYTTNIQQAVLDAGAGDEIWIAGGVYNTSGPIAITTGAQNVAIYGALVSGAGSVPAWSTRASALPTTITSNAPGGGQLMALMGCADITIDGVDFTGGSTSETLSGGAIYANLTTGTTIVNCDFVENVAGRGGAVAMVDSGGVTVTNCRFTRNETDSLDVPGDNWGGGGLWLNHIEADFADCVFNQNKSEDNGGALAAWDHNTTLTFTDCRFTSNWALVSDVYYDDGGEWKLTTNYKSSNKGGGGMSFISGNWNTLYLTLDNCTFNGNQCFGFGGGFLINGQKPLNDTTPPGTDVRVLNCFFTLNGTDIHLDRGRDGGAFYMRDANLTMENTKIIRGRANVNSLGFAVYGSTSEGDFYRDPNWNKDAATTHRPEDAAIVNITDCVVAGNQAVRTWGTGKGQSMGGFDISRATVQMNNCYLVANATNAIRALGRFQENRNVYSDGTYMSNCVVAGNFATYCFVIRFEGTAPTTFVNNTWYDNAAESFNRSLHIYKGSGSMAQRRFVPWFVNQLWYQRTTTWGQTVCRDQGYSRPLQSHCWYDQKASNGWGSIGNVPSGGWTDPAVAFLDRQGAPDWQPNIVEGTWDDVLPTHSDVTGITRLYDSDASFTPGALVGMVINPNTTVSRGAYIVANGATWVDIIDYGTYWIGAFGQNRPYWIRDPRPTLDFTGVDRGTSGTAHGHGPVPSVDYDYNARPQDWLLAQPEYGFLDTYDCGAFELVRSLMDLETDEVLFDQAILGMRDDLRAIDIANLGNETMQILSEGLIGPDAGEFVVQTPVSDVGAATTDVIEIEFTPSSSGTKTAYYVFTSDEPDTPMTTITLTGIAIVPTPEIAFTTPGLQFFDVFGFNVAGTESVTYMNVGLTTLSFTNGADSIMVVDDMGSSTSEFFIAANPSGAVDPMAPEFVDYYPPTPGVITQRTIGIGFDPTTTGLRIAYLQFETDDPTDPTTSVLLTGYVEPPVPDIWVYPRNFTFDPINAYEGPSASKDFTISNDGYATMTLDATDVCRLAGTDPDQFTIVSEPATSLVMPPFTVSTMTLTWSPTRYGLLEADVNVYSDDPDTPIMRNLVHGTPLLKGSGIDWVEYEF